MEGAISVIREEKLGGKLLAVVNELTPESRDALADAATVMPPHQQGVETKPALRGLTRSSHPPQSAADDPRSTKNSV